MQEVKFGEFENCIIGKKKDKNNHLTLQLVNGTNIASG